MFLSSKLQTEWDAAKIFEEDAPKKADPDNTYVATFPYPYMNGKLHLGKALIDLEKKIDHENLFSLKSCLHYSRPK